jgi:hypothetical protein
MPRSRVADAGAVAPAVPLERGLDRDACRAFDDFARELNLLGRQVFLGDLAVEAGRVFNQRDDQPSLVALVEVGTVGQDLVAQGLELLCDGVGLGLEGGVAVGDGQNVGHDFQSSVCLWPPFWAGE